MNDLTTIQKQSAAIPKRKTVIFQLSTALVDIEQPDIAIMPDFYSRLFEQQIKSVDSIEGVRFSSPTEEQVRIGAFKGNTGRSLHVMLDKIMNQQVESEESIIDGLDIIKAEFLDEAKRLIWDEQTEELSDKKQSELLYQENEEINKLLKPLQEAYRDAWENEAKTMSFFLPGVVEKIKLLQEQDVRVHIIDDWSVCHEEMSDFYRDELGLSVADGFSRRGKKSDITFINNVEYLNERLPVDLVPELVHENPQDCAVISSTPSFLTNAHKSGHRVFMPEYNPSLRDTYINYPLSLPEGVVKPLRSIDDFDHLFDPLPLPNSERKSSYDF